jgi:parvulin-like peptidyl-prolyl isomerase
MIASINTNGKTSNAEIRGQDLVQESRFSGKIPELIEGIIRRKIINEQALKVGIDSTELEIQTAADKFRITNQLESIEATNKWLQDRHISFDHFEQIIRQNLLASKVAEHLFGDRVEQHFHQNFLDYNVAILYEVIFKDRDLAMEIFYALQEGDVSFADVVRQYISDPELRRRGGYIGKKGRKQLHPEISAAIFAAKPPQLIKPVVTAEGVHLIQLAEIIEPKLDEQIHQQILTEMFDRWLTAKIAEIAPQTSIEI